MKTLSLIVLLAMASPAFSQAQTGFSGVVETPKVDAYGCSIVPRSERYTFTTFKDAWRSVAADRLYGLLRHQRVIEAESCSCGLLHPDWTDIDAAADEIGILNADRATLQEWAAEVYFPRIDALRDAVHKLCDGGA